MLSEISQGGQLDETPGAGKRRQGVDLVEVVGSLHEAILTLLEMLVNSCNIHGILQGQPLSIVIFLVE